MEVIVTPPARKQLESLAVSERKKVQRKILYLEKDIEIGKKLSGELEGQRSVRAWPHRIIYEVYYDRRKIYITSITHRQGVYK